MHAARDWDNSENKLKIELNTYKYDVLPSDVKAQIEEELVKNSDAHSQTFKYMLGIVSVETVEVDHLVMKFVLASMPERWMANVVGEADCLYKVWVRPKVLSDRLPDLSNFERVSQARSVIIRCA